MLECMSSIVYESFKAEYSPVSWFKFEGTSYSIVYRFEKLCGRVLITRQFRFRNNLNFTEYLSKLFRAYLQQNTKRFGVFSTIYLNFD